MTRLHLKSALACLAALGAALAAHPAAAQGTLYGVTYISNQLISVDPATGAGTLIAPLAAPGTPEGVAFSGGNLYDFNTATNALNRINPATGATISTVTLSPINGFGEGGMTFGNGVGYLYTPLDSGFNPVNSLYSFNPATGAIISTSATNTPLSALTFANNTLYGLGKADGILYSVNPATGLTTQIGDTGIAVGSPIGALSAGANGTLYASLNDALYTLNPATGAATAIGDPNVGIGFSSVSGLAFQPAAVPEPGAVGLLAGALAFGSGFALRRRRK